MKIIILLALGWVMGIAAIQAQSGTTLGVPVDTRGIGMGNTYVAGSESNGIYTNLAAGVLMDRKMNATFSYRPWLNELTDGYRLASANVGYTLGHKHHLSVGYQNFTLPGYDISDDFGNVESRFKPREYRLGLGYAYRVNTRVALSLALHYFRSDISADYAADAMLVDLAFKGQSGHFEYGAVVKNLGSKLKFPYGEVSLPMVMATGFAYGIPNADGSGFRGHLDLSYLSNGDENNGFALGIGGEYAYRNSFFLRTGYYRVDENMGLNNFSVGAGIAYRDFKFDFAYLIADNALNKSYSATLSWFLNR